MTSRGAWARQGRATRRGARVAALGSTCLVLGTVPLCGGVLAACGSDEPVGRSGGGEDASPGGNGGRGGVSGTATGRVPSLTAAAGASGVAPDSAGGSGGNVDAGIDSNGGAGDDGGADADFDAPPDGPPVCGDGWRDTVTEECDDGIAAHPDTCDERCRVRDVLVGPNEAVDGPLHPAGRMLGAGRHTVAASTAGFAVVLVEHQRDPTAVKLRAFDSKGVPQATAIDVNGTATAVDDSDPVVAALPDGRYAVAWTDLGGDGDGRGIALRMIDPAAPASGRLDFANARRSWGQQRPDIVATDSELVVAWTDDAEVTTTRTNLRYRRFLLSGTALTGSDETLASTPALEDNVSLTKFGSGWAAAWTSVGGGTHSIRVKAGSTEWSVGPARLADSTDRIALAEIDLTHLFLAFVSVVAATDAVPETPRLHWAVLDTAAPGAATWMALEPKVEAETIGARVEHGQPNVVRVGDSLYLAWQSFESGGDSGELWLKRIPIVPGAPNLTLEFGAEEIGIPREEGHRIGRQWAPALAATGVRGSLALLAGWNDSARTFGPGAGAPDVVVQMMPTPILRLPKEEMGR